MLINFLDPNEAPTLPSVLKRMSEDGRCLLTGEKENLVYFPVDTNPQNFLPSNMSCIADSIAKEITYTFNYDIELWGYKLTFDSPPVFKSYNENTVNIATTMMMDDKERFNPPSYEKFTAFYEYLTKLHVKGLSKISYDNISIDANQYQGHLLRLLANAKASTPKSKIITSPNLGLVKP